MIKKFGFPILTLFGVGYFKYAPGTAASFITCLIYFTLTESAFSLGINKFYIVVFLFFVLFYSIIFIDKLSPVFKKKDPREIVIDEFVGQCIPLASILFRPDGFIPNCCYKDTIEEASVIWILLSFILFRFFDILKPFPINYVDKNTNGALGIMLDDIIAGFFTIIVMTIIFFFIGG